MPTSTIRYSGFLVTLLATWTAAGAAIALSAFTPGWQPTTALLPVPPWLSLGVGGFTAGGTIMASYGLWPAARRSLESDRWRIESAGCLLAATGWLAFAVMGLVLAPTAALIWIVGGGSSIAMSLRGLYILRVARETRHNVNEAGGPQP